MIKLIDFSKKYNGEKDFAVKNIFLEADKGVNCILGLNGAGKSTLIKAIAGEHFPSSGNILLSDSSSNFYDVSLQREKALLTLGYIPEISDLPEKLYVSEYLFLYAKMRGLSNEELKKNLKKVIFDCEISEILSKKISSLSKGFKQRLMFSLSLISNPENLVYDESVNGLDPAQIIQFRSLIKKISKEKTVLLSTHIMQEVHSLADKIYILHKGRILVSGTEQEILLKTNSENIEDAFIKLTSEGK